MESTLYHGSNKIVEHPSLTGGQIHNDFGQGFYCTPDMQMACEWACGAREQAFVNCYSLEPGFSLEICDLSKANYHVLNWLALLLRNRVFETRHSVPSAIKAYILETFLPDVSFFDIIRGYRADDSYFSIASAFIEGSITLGQLSAALKLGELGEQVFLQSEKAFEALVFTTALPVDRERYLPRRMERDEKARTAFRKMRENTADGILAIDIFREKWTNEDERLR